MNENYKLEENHTVFFEKLDGFIQESENLLQKKYNTIDEIDNDIESWENNISKYIEAKVIPKPEILINEFRKSSKEDFQLFLLKKYRNIDSSKEKLSRKTDKLKVLKGYLSIIDSFENKSTQKINLSSIQEKILYVLSKLYKLYGDNYYSVEIIFAVNQINFNKNEPYEIAENLKKRGYAVRENDYSDDDIIKITVKGVTYYERKNNSKKRTNQSSKNKEIDEKINQVIISLQELQLGQEIIFDELEDLRVLSKKLSKKNWSEILKGKLLGLAVEEVINSETTSYIFKSLTDNSMKFLK